MKKKRSEFVAGVIMLNFPTKKYNLILADPAWTYALGTRDGQASNHYDTMPLEDICNLPVREISDKNCYLFLWATSPTLKEALEVMERWGFSYRTVAFVWSKTNQIMGLGHYTRTNHEFVLLGKKGTLERKSRKVAQWIKAPAKRQSEKPNRVREDIVKLYGDLPRIELFGRINAVGWDTWGNDSKLKNKPLEVFS